MLTAPQRARLPGGRGLLTTPSARAWQGIGLDLEQLLFTASIGGLPCTDLAVAGPERLRCSTGAAPAQLAARPLHLALTVAMPGFAAQSVPPERGIEPPLYSYLAPPRVLSVSPACGQPPSQLETC